MKFLVYASFLLMFMAVIGPVHAQKKNNATTPVKKFKPPKLYSFLLNYKDSVTKVTRDEAIRAINSGLRVTDEKKGLYKITYYNFLYKRVVVTEDESSGKLSPATSVISDHFTNSPLPALWLNTISEQLKPGEELYFFDIIAKDAQGRIMYAPNIKLVIR